MKSVQQHRSISHIEYVYMYICRSLAHRSNSDMIKYITCLPNFKNNTHADIHANKAINKFRKQTTDVMTTGNKPKPDRSLPLYHLIHMYMCVSDYHMHLRRTILSAGATIAMNATGSISIFVAINLHIYQVVVCALCNLYTYLSTHACVCVCVLLWQNLICSRNFVTKSNFDIVIQANLP